MSNNSASVARNLNILFIRHGETQDNIDRILQGWSDTSLTDKGHQEAEVIASKLQSEQIDAIYRSPLHRIKQTVEHTLRAHSNVPVYADEELKGQGLGELEGDSYDSIDMSDPRSADGRPGVELFDDFVRRLTRVLGRIVSAEAMKVQVGRDRNVVVATHGVCITSMFKVLEGTQSSEEFGSQVAIRGPEAFEVRWTDSDDIAKLVVSRPATLPVSDGVLEWDKVDGQPFFIERWGKKEKAL